MYFGFGHLNVRLAHLENLLTITKPDAYELRDEIRKEIRNLKRQIRSALDTLSRNKRG